MNKQVTCRFLRIALSTGKAQSLIHATCPGIATHNGYCTEHQYAARLLEKARYYGCPEMLPVRQSPKTKEREGLIIRQGLHNWQAYCDVVSPGNALVMERRLDAEYGQMFKREGVA